MEQNSVPSYRLGDTPIAIVGLGALYPRSGDLGEFWDNIVEGADCIEDVPESHWRIDDHYSTDPTAPDKTYSKRGGFVPTVPFHPMEFGLPPNTLEVTDVLQLLSLVVAKQALRDAGVAEDQDLSRTGVVLGITGANSLTQPLATRLQTPVVREVVRSCGLSERDAEEIAAKFAKAFAPWEENSFPGMLGNVVAGRIANRFDLGGMNAAVDAACASSLAAVRMAVSELVSGRADVMLTGGCDAENTILMYLCFSKTPALSRNDCIRPFDEGGDGTLIGEGTGMLALKRLADAERDGDRIYSVLKGIGTSSDGRSKSIYAPRREGQVKALKRAYEDAGFGPDQVTLMECHGTGTPVGDLTELTALRDVYSEASDERQFAAVGSVKSQIGHTKAAAGAAGMIKLSLALHQRVLPPTINVERPREAMDFPNSPFYVNTTSRPWIGEPERERRRAALSSFGFGGTNFHCVLEEHGSGEEVSALAAAHRVSVWHAPGPAELLDLLDSEEPGSDPQEAIPADHARLAVAAENEEEAAELRSEAARRLRSAPDTEEFSLPKGGYYRRAAMSETDRGRVAALFAGQGSQYTGMGARAAMAVAPVRAAFDEAAAEFAGAEPLGRVVFPPAPFEEAGRQKNEEALRSTDYAQPAIGALSVGHYRYLESLGFSPDGVVGHSFGELTALWSSGSLSDEDFFRLARGRGLAMAERPEATAEPGTMAALRASLSDVEKLLSEHEDVWVCNVNTPGQIVVGGGTEAVRALIASCGEDGVRAHELPVAAAFHTPYVAHAVESFAETVGSAEIRAPRVPVYANSPGASYGTDGDVNRRVLVDQLTSPVHFAPQVERMYEEGFRVFVEFGPKSVLAGMVRETLADRKDVVVLSADAGPKVDGDLSLKRLAAQLTVLGLPLTRLNRFTSETPVPPPSKGMSIPLNGVNYVSEERRQAYEESLENGYRISPDGSGDGSPQQVPAHDPAPTAPAVTPAPAPVAAAPAPAVTPSEIGMITSEHLAMHREYLSGQMRVADRLSHVLAEEAGHGGPNEAVLSGIHAVTNHSLAISRSQVQASEVLRGFVEQGSANRADRTDSTPVQPQFAMARPAFAPVHEIGPAAGSHHNGNPDGNGQASRAAAPAPAPSPDVPAPVPAPAAPVPAPEPAPAPAASVPGAALGGNTVGEVRGVLLQIVAEKTGYPADMLETSMDIEADLGIDSIKRVEIMGGLRDRFPEAATGDPEKLAELSTLDDIIAFVSGDAGGGEGAPESSVPGAAVGGSTVGEVRGVLLQIVAEKTGYPADMLETSMDIEADLGIDSIKRVEIMGGLRDRFPEAATGDPEKLAELSTLDDIIAFVSGAEENGEVVGSPKA